MHIAELSTPVVEVAIKVINASLTQNQCLQCVTPPLTHVEILRPRRHWTEQWRHDQVGLPNRTEFYYFFRKSFNQRWLQFLFAYSFRNWLAVSCFSFWKTFVKCPSLSVNGIFDDVRYDVIPRNDVAALGWIFWYFSTLKYQDDLCQKLRNCV